MLAAINTFNSETRKADYFILPAARRQPGRRARRGRDQGFLRPAQGRLSHAGISQGHVLIVRRRSQRPPFPTTPRGKAYDRDAAQRFAAPEKRAVSQLTFPTARPTAKAEQRVADGKSSRRSPATSRPAECSPTWATTKAAIFDKAVADAAFALPSPASPGRSRASSARFWHASQIEPGKLKSFDDVKDQIKAELAQGAGQGRGAEQHDK